MYRTTDMRIGLPRLAAFGLGIVSSLECEGGGGLSPCADAVYFIEDKPRGGRPLAERDNPGADFGGDRRQGPARTRPFPWRPRCHGRQDLKVPPAWPASKID
jgi:hypothetical protein